MNIVEIGDLPLYNEDIDGASPPAAYSTFRQQVRSSDAVLFVTPEYNRSVPAPLKNAIDVGSRPYGQSAWSGKPGAIISVSPGAVGGFGANHHLRQSLVFLDVPCMQQPEAYLGGAGSVFDEAGKLSEKTKPFLQAFIDAYGKWVENSTADRRCGNGLARDGDVSVEDACTEAAQSRASPSACVHVSVTSWCAPARSLHPRARSSLP